MSLDEVVAAAQVLAGEVRALRAAIRARTWLMAALLALVAVVGVGGAWWSLGESRRLHDLVDQDCGAFRAIGTIPLPASAAPVAHDIVDGARQAYDGRCTGVLGPLPPAPTVTPTPTR